MKQRGRVLILPYLPALNRLVKHGLITPEEMKTWTERYMGAQTFSKEDIVLDIMSLSVEEEKMDLLAEIVKEIQNVQGGNKNG